MTERETHDLRWHDSAECFHALASGAQQRKVEGEGGGWTERFQVEDVFDLVQ